MPADHNAIILNRLDRLAQCVRDLDAENIEVHRAEVTTYDAVVSIYLQPFLRRFAGRDVTVTHHPGVDTYVIESDGIHYVSSDLTPKAVTVKTETIRLPGGGAVAAK